MKKNLKLVNLLEKHRLIALANVPKEGIAVKLAENLLDAGVKWLEITFRNEYCEKALKELNNADSGIIYGAGTVRTIDQLDSAIKSGANYIVTPGFNEKIVEYAQEIGITIFPGVDSTYGIEKASNLGINILKMFPASVIGGINWLKAMSGPYFDFKFIPTGGINLENLSLYLSQKNVIAVGGSFLVPKDLLLQENFEEIKKIAKQAVEIVKMAKST
ncbi:MAG: bifunctional 4-hydroxy-2-oxoglutarate aldolase/2-dehydro-3-deoxy-phosphogluconate aldolase [Promethearchaeota archaeon]